MREHDEPVTSEESGLTLDDLFNMEVDQAEVEETLRRGLLPHGTYTTNPDEFGPMTVTPLERDEKDDRGDVLSRRKIIVLTGRGRATVRIGNELKQVEGRLRVELSPEYRDKLNYATKETLEGTPDSKSALYAQAVKAFQSTFGEKPKNAGQVVEFLRDHPARFRMIQIGVPSKNNPEPDGEPRNFVIAISPVRNGSR